MCARGAGLYHRAAMLDFAVQGAHSPRSLTIFPAHDEDAGHAPITMGPQAAPNPTPDKPALITAMMESRA